MADMFAPYKHLTQDKAPQDFDYGLWVVDLASNEHVAKDRAYCVNRGLIGANDVELPVWIYDTNPDGTKKSNPTTSILKLKNVAKEDLRMGWSVISHKKLVADYGYTMKKSKKNGKDYYEWTDADGDMVLMAESRYNVGTHGVDAILASTYRPKKDKVHEERPVF